MKTVTFGVRLPEEKKEKLSKYLTRSCLESMLEQIEKGEIEVSDHGITAVNTDSKSVNTKTETVNTCDGCPYMEVPDMSKFNEVCEFKGLDKQKAMDKCVQMLWR